MYADYTFYIESYYGTMIKESDFPRLSSRASDYLDYYTRGKAATATDNAVVTALAKACCAVAEQMMMDDDARAIAAVAYDKAKNNGELKSEKVGSYSVSYATAADYIRNDTANALQIQNSAYSVIARRYLTNTGLLYRGGC